MSAAVASPSPSILGRIGRGLRMFARRAPMSAFWGCIVVLIVGMSIAAPIVAPYNPVKSDFRAMTEPPSEKHVFGTDQIGRDTLSRVIHGSRASLTVAVSAVLLGTTVGALWGLACGYFGGRFDLASQRIMEFLQSFPDLILAMAIAMALGAGLGTVIIAIAITIMQSEAAMKGNRSMPCRTPAEATDAAKPIAVIVSDAAMRLALGTSASIDAGSTPSMASSVSAVSNTASLSSCRSF